MPRLVNFIDDNDYNKNFLKSYRNDISDLDISEDADNKNLEQYAISSIIKFIDFYTKLSDDLRNNKNSTSATEIFQKFKDENDENDENKKEKFFKLLKKIDVLLIKIIKKAIKYLNCSN